MALLESFNLDLNGDAVVDFHFKVTGSSYGGFVSNAASVGAGAETTYPSNPGGNMLYHANLTTFLALSKVDQFVSIFFPPTTNSSTQGPLGLIGAKAIVGTSTFTGGNFVGSRGFIGIQFDIPGGSPHFGWVDLELNSEASLLTIYAYGYESDPNTGILAGAGSGPSQSLSPQR